MRWRAPESLNLSWCRSPPVYSTLLPMHPMHISAASLSHKYAWIFSFCLTSLRQPYTMLPHSIGLVNKAPPAQPAHKLSHLRPAPKSAMPRLSCVQIFALSSDMGDRASLCIDLCVAARDSQPFEARRRDRRARCRSVGSRACQQHADEHSALPDTAQRCGRGLPPGARCRAGRAWRMFPSNPKFQTPQLRRPTLSIELVERDKHFPELQHTTTTHV